MWQVGSDIVTGVYYGIDAIGKISSDYNATSNVAKLISLPLKYVNNGLKDSERVLSVFSHTLEAITGCSSIKNWAEKVISLVSGQAAGLNLESRIQLQSASIDEEIRVRLRAMRIEEELINRIATAGLDDVIRARLQAAGADSELLDRLESPSIINVAKIASTVAFLVGDILGSFEWLDKMELISLSQVASKIASVSMFKEVANTVFFLGVSGFTAIGTLFDLIDTCRDIVQNELGFNLSDPLVEDVQQEGVPANQAFRHQQSPSLYNLAQIVSSVAKIAGILFATSSGVGFAFGLLTAGVSTTCSLARFIMKKYSVGMPQHLLQTGNNRRQAPDVPAPVPEGHAHEGNAHHGLDDVD